MTRFDVILVVVLLGVSLCVTPVASAVSSRGHAESVTVVGPQGSTTVPLEEPRRLVVKGLRGDVVVVLDGHGVRVAESDCPDQVCVRTGLIASPGATIVCIPNGVSVTVGGDDHEAADVIVR
ncbi:MAG: NusG domain II-containing protein [Coriobacteriales bacterium]|nr:NusG domain II-containing protein [Actinomycetes bacterium]